MEPLVRGRARRRQARGAASSRGPPQEPGTTKWSAARPARRRARSARPEGRDEASRLRSRPKPGGILIQRLRAFHEEALPSRTGNRSTNLLTLDHRLKRRKVDFMFYI